ncbi:MAG TPA: ATP-binding protein [Acidimicrobiales bacterium]|nr:ATP-binding protein [Acidimicrobiales bacterium]
MLSRLKVRGRIVLVAAVQAVAFAGAVVVLGAGAPSGRVGLAAGFFVAGAVVAIGLATVVARSVAAPLRRLEDAARRGARLPNLVEALRRPTGRDHDLALTPVGLSSDDEIGRAARAFDAFQGEAAKLAVSHASLMNKGVADKGTFEVFVNLARRMQSLVDHQIDLLDGLEAGEEDPDALENLFRLDHLATRVRRNAESLLTMAGAASSRSWERPLAVADVLRAGMAEVEDLARIDLEIEDEVAVLGNVAADAAHLLSELLENAARWSPPETRVHVLGRQRPGGYEIVVTDSGIGMPVETLAEANHILTGPPLAGATVARALGLVVAGRLARRLGIGVRLTTPDRGGVTAHVVLPPSLLVAAADAADETAAAGSSRTLPFALARQEKRARISSQRRRSPSGERRGAPAGDVPTIIPLPEPATTSPSARATVAPASGGPVRMWLASAKVSTGMPMPESVTTIS